MNRYTALILALLMALLCVLPVSLAEETVTAETAATEATEAPAAEDQVLATLANGTQIMQSEVDAIANQVISYYANYGYDMSSEDTLPIVRQMAMETYLQENFYKDSLVTLGLDQLTEEDMAAIEKNVDEVYEGLIDQVYTYYGLEPAEDATEEEKATARANAIATLDSMGYTYDYIVLNETESYNYDKVTRALTADLSVSEEDLLATYNAHVEEDKAAYADDPGLYEQTKSYYGDEPFFVPEGFRGITHILLQVDSELLSTYQDLQSRYEEYAEPVDAAQAAPEAEAAASEEPAVTEEPVTEEAAEPAVVIDYDTRAGRKAIAQLFINEILSVPAGSLTRWSDMEAKLSAAYGTEVKRPASIRWPATTEAGEAIPYWRIVGERGAVRGDKMIEQSVQEEKLKVEGHEFVNAGHGIFSGIKVEGYKEKLV